MATTKPSAADLRNPDYVPPMGADRVGAELSGYFVSNFTPAIIIGGAASYYAGDQFCVYPGHDSSG